MVRLILLSASLVVALSTGMSARAELPSNLGSAPTLEWGEHRVSLQGGWPVQSLGLGWGTALGWNNSVFGTLDIRAPAQTWGVGMAFCRPFAHGERTSLFFHFAGAALLQAFEGRPRMGGEGQTGLTLGVGLGKQRRVTWEVGVLPSFRFGPGIAEPRPVLRLRGCTGLTAWIGPVVAISARGGLGFAGIVGTRPDPDWAAGLEFARIF